MQRDGNGHAEIERFFISRKSEAVNKNSVSPPDSLRLLFCLSSSVDFFSLNGSRKKSFTLRTDKIFISAAAIL